MPPKVTTVYIIVQWETRSPLKYLSFFLLGEGLRKFLYALLRIQGFLCKIETSPLLRSFSCSHWEFVPAHVHRQPTSAALTQELPLVYSFHPGHDGEASLSRSLSLVSCSSTARVYLFILTFHLFSLKPPQHRNNESVELYVYPANV